MGHNITLPSLQEKLPIEEQKLDYSTQPSIDSKDFLAGEDSNTCPSKSFEIQESHLGNESQSHGTDIEYHTPDEWSVEEGDYLPDVEDGSWAFASLKSRETDPFFVLDSHQRRPLVSWTKLASRHQRPFNLPNENMYTRREQDEMRLRFCCKAWPNGTMLRVRFLNGTGHQKCAAMAILRSHDGWTRSANIDFILAKDDVAKEKPRQVEVRILFVQNTTSIADLGFDAVYTHPAEPTVQLNESCLVYGSLDLLHEAGHVLGVHHEHQRCILDTNMDVQAVYKHLSSTPHEQIHSEILHRMEETRIDPFEYEPRSTMHYGLHALPAGVFSNNKAIQNVDASESSSGRGLAPKDHKLIAYLYPLPAGGHITPKHVQAPGDILTRAKRQTIMLPHVWGSTPRVMLGIRQLHWNSDIISAGVNLWATSRSQQHFQLEVFGVNTLPEISWLAIDPLIGGIQVSSFKSSRGNAFLDPWQCYSVETHELKPNISSSAKIALWLEEIGRFDTSKDFFVKLDAKVRLKKHHKELNLYYGANDSIKLRAKWMIINPSALNIDGGQVVCKEGEPRSGKILFKDNLGFEHWGPKAPQVLAGIHGFRYRAALGQEPHEVWFKIDIHHLNASGFMWRARTCHEECLPELRFSWVVVPSPLTPYFGVPKGADRPKYVPRTAQTREKRLAEDMDEDVAVVKDFYEGLSSLFT